jgi:hypothetical protein
MMHAERWMAEQLFSHGLSRHDATLEARADTLTIISRADSEAERAALLRWADAECGDFGLAPLSLILESGVI